MGCGGCTCGSISNILKRLLVHIAGLNLGLLLRREICVGTPRGLQDRVVAGVCMFGVKYFCRSTSTILAGFGRLLVRRRTVRWALLRVLKTQKTKRRERPLGDVHGVR